MRRSVSGLVAIAMQDRWHVGFVAILLPNSVFMRHHLRFEIRVVLLLDPLPVSTGAARCPVSDLCHEEVMLASCLWRGYIPAGEIY